MVRGRPPFYSCHSFPNKIEAVITGIPLFSIGIFAIGFFTFLLVLKRVNMCEHFTIDIIVIANVQQALHSSLYFVFSWFPCGHSGPRPNFNEGRLKHREWTASRGRLWIHHRSRGSARPIGWSGFPVLLDLRWAAATWFDLAIGQVFQYQDDQNLVTLCRLGALGLHRVGTQVGNPSHLHSHPDPADSMEGRPEAPPIRWPLCRCIHLRDHDPNYIHSQDISQSLLDAPGRTTAGSPEQHRTYLCIAHERRPRDREPCVV